MLDLFSLAGAPLASLHTPLCWAFSPKPRVFQRHRRFGCDRFSLEHGLRCSQSGATDAVPVATDAAPVPAVGAATVQKTGQGAFTFKTFGAGGSSSSDRHRANRNPLSFDKFAPEDRYDYIYGIYPVLLALSTRRRYIKTLWYQGKRETQSIAPKDLEARRQIEEFAAERKVEMLPASKMQLDTMCIDRPHQGYVLKCSIWDIPMLQAIPKSRPRGIYLVLEQVEDPQNLGTVVRCAGFFGVQGVLVQQGLTRVTGVASKASAGTTEWMELSRTHDLSAALLKFRARGWTVAGMALPDIDTSEGDQKVPVVPSARLDSWLSSFVKTEAGGRGVVLVMGSEGRGLTSGVKQTCNVLVSIAGGSIYLDSLNVSVAAGCALHSIRTAIGPPQSLGDDEEEEEEEQEEEFPEIPEIPDTSIPAKRGPSRPPPRSRPKE